MFKLRYLTAICLLCGLALITACQSSPDSEPASEEQTLESPSVDGSVSDGEEPPSDTASTATVPPTSTPLPTNTPAPTEPPASQIELGEPIRSEEFGFSIQPLPKFEVETLGSTVFMSQGEDDAEAALVFSADQVAGGPTTAEGVVESFSESVVGDDGTLGEIVDIEINGYSGVAVDFSGVDDGIELAGQIIVLEDEDRLITIFGGSNAERWEQEFGDQFDAVVNSVELFTPTVVAEETEEVESEMAEQGDTMTGETIIDEANGFSIVVPAQLTPNKSEATIFMADPINLLGANIVFSVVPVPDGVDGELIADSIKSSVLLDDYTVEEPEVVSINGSEGTLFRFAGEESGEPIEGAFAVITASDKVAFMTGVAPAEIWQSDLMAMFDTTLGTIELTPGAAETVVEDSGTASQAEQSAEGSETADESESAAPVAVSSGSGGDGFACVSGDDVGLSCITPDGEWVTYNEENSALSSNYVTAMTACPSGTILSAGFDNINIFNGESFVQLPGDWGFSTPDALACGSNDEIWVVYFEGASRYADGAWTNFEYSEFASDGGGLVYDVAIGPDGTAWIVTSNIIASYNNGAWTEYKEGSGLADQYFFSNVTVTPSGTPYVSFSSGFLTLDGSEWIEVDSGGYESFEQIVINSAGDLFLATFDEGVKRFDGSTFATIDQSAGLPTTSLRTLTGDQSDRVWVGTDYGLSVIGSDGISTFLMANSELTDNQVQHIAVAGTGPNLPALISKENGSMNGNIVLDDGTPLANAAVEICVEPFYSSFYGETPCSDQPLFFQSSTDEAGEFEFNDIPAGQYVMVFFVEDGWAQLSNEYGFGSGRVPVAPTENTYVGEITIEPDEE